MNFIDNESINLKEEFYRFFSFWPIYIISIFILFISSFIYLRYADTIYLSTAKIKILDDALDSEMALPTAMTIFNRSMINLENEVEQLKSFTIVEQAVKELNSNISFYEIGRIRESQKHYNSWFDDVTYEFDIKSSHKFNSTSQVYIISFTEDGMKIEPVEDSNSDNSYFFDKFSTYNIKNDLPFNLSLDVSEIYQTFNKEYKLQINDIYSTVQYMVKKLKVKPIGADSDLLAISIEGNNSRIDRDFINVLIDKFNKDGIIDRQLVFKSTIDFVDSRFDLLKSDLDNIENYKQQFKENNSLSYIEKDAIISTEQKFKYESELFNAKTQYELTDILYNNIKDNSKLNYMPGNIGIDNIQINDLINDYNNLISERFKYNTSVGKNNNQIKILEKQINNASNTIVLSIKNYQKALNSKIKNIEDKGAEFISQVESVPFNEKQLREISREQQIKESLFLLLLQKREEASINYAVTKPSIKIIDSALTNSVPVAPRRVLIYIGSIILGILVPTFCLYLWFLTDTKIHTREHLNKALKNTPIIGEIPNIFDKNILTSIAPSNSRDALAESVRMIIANLNFILFNDGPSSKKNNLILITSSIKGEGKTIVSVNTALALSAKFDKVLLIGADLRNPQIHKFLELDKNIKGLSDYIYKDDLNWKDLIIKKNKLDFILSGKIPPNPTELLSSKKFENFINEVKKSYDYVIIDSAPCLLVSDTFEISKYVDTTLYVVRSNYSDIKLCDFINESISEGKLSNLNLVLNGVGNSSSYGYKYGYQYGYKYGYKYGYNYGYGYGYSEDDD